MQPFLQQNEAVGPTPHGVGGLKFELVCSGLCPDLSHPSRGGWIEMAVAVVPPMGLSGPTPHGVGGLKFPRCQPYPCRYSSHPSRGGWIEIGLLHPHGPADKVPPLTGWVD